jgi:hypothetical protein
MSRPKAQPAPSGWICNEKELDYWFEFKKCRGSYTTSDDPVILQFARLLRQFRTQCRYDIIPLGLLANIDPLRIKEAEFALFRTDPLEPKKFNSEEVYAIADVLGITVGHWPGLSQYLS